MGGGRGLEMAGLDHPKCKVFLDVEARSGGSG